MVIVECMAKDPLVEFWHDEAQRPHLDVRALLEDGGEPYRVIMSCVQQLQPGELMVLHALFEPTPLMRQLERMGFNHLSHHEGPDHWTLRIERPVA